MLKQPRFKPMILLVYHLLENWPSSLSIPADDRLAVKLIFHPREQSDPFPTPEIHHTKSRVYIST